MSSVYVWSAWMQYENLFEFFFYLIRSYMFLPSCCVLDLGPLPALSYIIHQSNRILVLLSDSGGWGNLGHIHFSDVGLVPTRL